MASLLMLIILVLLNTVNSFYSGHCRDPKLVSSLARVRNSESLFQSILCNFFYRGFCRCPYYRGVRKAKVDYITLATESGSVLYGIVPWDSYRFFYWLLPGRAGRWVKFGPQSKPIVQFITEPNLSRNRNFSIRAIFV